MRKLIVAVGMLAALMAAGDAIAVTDEPAPPPNEDGICIPVHNMPQCTGPNPPAWCGEYDPNYEDWFMPELPQLDVMSLFRPIVAKYAK